MRSTSPSRSKSAKNGEAYLPNLNVVDELMRWAGGVAIVSRRPSRNRQKCISWKGAKLPRRVLRDFNIDKQVVRASHGREDRKTRRALVTKVGDAGDGAHHEVE